MGVVERGDSGDHRNVGSILRSWALALLLVVLVAASAATGAARAGTGFFVGFADDSTKWYGAPAASAARALGAKALRFTLLWSPGETTLSDADASGLRAAVSAATGLRPILVVYGANAADAPQDDASRDDYCSFVRSALQQVPQVNDVEIWIEPNKQAFWKPQFDADGHSVAPAAYEALLARCWDVLHAFRPGVNVIGPATSSNGNDDPNAGSNVSHSPGNFIRRLGDAYRASGRTLPILDTIGTHVYGANSAERPWKQHPGGTMIGEGDWGKLMQNLHAAFDGTAQPVPGQCVGGRCVSIWYLEDGFQTAVDPSKARFYHGTESDQHALPPVAGAASSSADGAAPDQATQIADAVRLAACQPYVGAFFNFELVDEPDLRGWQSGVFWADLSAKPSYFAFRSAFTSASAGAADCSGIPGLPSAAAAAPEATIDSGPSGTSAGRVTFAFSAGGGTVAGFQCSLDGAAYAPCSSPRSYSLPSGRHTFRVRVVDATGDVDASPAATAWTVDATPPDTSVGGGPTTFRLAATEPASFECSLDGAAYAPCSSPLLLRGLAPGAHRLAVSAIDAVGNVDPTPALVTWKLAGAAAAAGPAGDDFADAITLTGASGSVSADTTAATREPGEPTILGNQGGHSLWFRWTAPASGPVTFDTVGSAFDTQLAVWRGAALASLTAVAEDDDHGGNRTSRVSFDAVAGTTYEIQVDGFAGTTGPSWFGALALNWR
jgi:hypothetical protein